MKICRINLFIFLFLGFAAEAYSQAHKTFSVADIEDLLRSGVSHGRVATLIEERGVNFEVTNDIRNKLKKASADTRVMLAVERKGSDFFKTKLKEEQRRAEAERRKIEEERRKVEAAQRKIEEEKQKLENARRAEEKRKREIGGLREEVPVVSSIGLTVKESMGVNRANRVVIMMVELDSPAEEAGLRRGDVILEIDRKSIRKLSDYQKAITKIKKGKVWSWGARVCKGVLFFVRRGETKIFLALKPC